MSKKRKIERKYEIIQTMEKKFDLALEKLVHDNFILEFYKVKLNGELDSLGIDYFLYLKGGLLYPIQLKFKSSERNFGNAVRHHYEKHPFVSEIFGVGSNAQFFQIADMLKEAVMAAVRRTKEI